MPHYRVEYTQDGIPTSHRFHGIETDEEAVRLYRIFKDRKEEHGGAVISNLVFVEKEEETRRVRTD